MKRLLDLRFVIGVFFLIVGVLLLVNSFAKAQEGTDVNRWCGIIFSVFGILMIALSTKGGVHDELLEEDSH